jgi:Helix-turn-helix domain of resolvase
LHWDCAAVLPLTFCGSKTGATFCLAMISISSGLKLRASQRCRNNCLTLEMENGPRQIFRFAATPPPCCVGGRGDGSRSHGLELTHSFILYDIRNDGVLKLLDPLVMAPEMELGFIRDRQRAGIDAAKAKGIYKGRPATFDRARIVALRKEGMGATEIAKAVGCKRGNVYKTHKAVGLN